MNECGVCFTIYQQLSKKWKAVDHTQKNTHTHTLTYKRTKSDHEYITIN